MPTVPIGAYLTDGQALLEVLESDDAGALGEDVRSGEWVAVEADELAGPEPHWRRVTPAGDEAAA